MVISEQATPTFVRLAAHPVRWRLLTSLAASDYRVRELVELVGEPQNLVSYHLRRLRDGALVTMRRSSFDARDSYYHLDLDRCAQALAAAGTALHPALGPGPAPPPPSTPAPARRPAVLFACTGNSARSPTAQALLGHRGGGHVTVASAGSHPRQQLHPDAVRALRVHYGIDIANQHPQSLEALAGRRFDYVISLCDKVREVCPEFPDHPRRVHWSIPDPATAPGGYPDFVRIAAEIDTRIRYLLTLLAHTQREVQP